MTTSIAFDASRYYLPSGAAPAEYDTVASFIAKHWPEEIEDLIAFTGANVDTAYEREERELRTIIERLGFRVFDVQVNGTTRPAFDVQLLREMLPRM